MRGSTVTAGGKFVTVATVHMLIASILGHSSQMVLILSYISVTQAMWPIFAWKDLSYAKYHLVFPLWRSIFTH